MYEVFATAGHPKCTLCHDPRRHDIESEVALGARLRATARKHQISYDALWRHWHRHLTADQRDRLKFGDAPVHKLKGMLADESISVLRDLNFARASIIQALTATPVQDGHARAVLSGRLHENARIRGQISGELSNSKLVVNNNFQLLADPRFAEFQSDLVRVLVRFPDALRAVQAEFERLEQPALEHNPDGREEAA